MLAAATVNASTIRRTALWIALLAALLYAPTLSFPFVNFDDPGYVYSNPHVVSGLSLANVRWAFEIHGPSMWIPLTWLSHQAIATVFDNQAAAHHALNTLLHALNAALLFLLCQRLTHNHARSAWVAAIFAVHPVHVESVAWVTERKDVLCLFFCLLALFAYLRFVRMRSFLNYTALLLAFAAALMAKPMAVTLPCLLFVLDFWPLRNPAPIVRRVLDKLPLLALSAGAAGLTVLCQIEARAIGSLDAFPLATRLLNATQSYALYLLNLLWPSNLAAFYPYAPPDFAAASLAIATLLGLSCLCLLALRRFQNPAPLVGWLWFLGCLIPMIGIVQAGAQSMADRYLYLPAIGVYLALAFAFPKSPLPRARTVALAFSIPAALALAASPQVRVWQSSATLFQHAIAAGFPSALAHNNLGLALRDQRQFHAAIHHFDAALRLDPTFHNALTNRGITQIDLGDVPSGAADLQAALAIAPHSIPALHNLAKAQAALGNATHAHALFGQALQADPLNANIRYDFAHLLIQQQQFQAARTQLEALLARNPAFTDAWVNLGVAFAHLGHPQQASAAYQSALALSPNHPIAIANLAKLIPAPVAALTPNDFLAQGRALRQQKHLQEAIDLYLEALAHFPADPDLLNDFGVTLGRVGLHDAALAQFEAALAIDPDHALARQNKAAAEAALH